MTGLKVKITVMLLVMGLSTQAFAHVSLNNPVGGETFEPGEMVTIQWTELVAHNTINWDLYFSSDGGATWDAILLDIDYGTLSYAWTVPDVNTTQGVVRVVQDNQGMNYDAACLDFTIMVDTAPPAIVDGAHGLDIECDVQLQAAMIQSWLDENGMASATSSCGALDWTNDYSGLADDCGGESGDATVTFTVTDECGKTSVTSAAITVTDNTAPSIDNAAQDLIVECDGTDTPQEVTTWLNNHGNATASDACGMVAWTHEHTVVGGGCSNTGTSVVMFTVTDECGNTSTTSATLVVEDTSAPVVETGGQDITIECNTADQQVDIQVWIAGHAGAVANDACGDVTWSNDYAGLSEECGAAGSAVVTFTITDECGNSSTTQASLTVEDTRPPTMEKVAQDISLECDDVDRSNLIQDWLDNFAGASAADMCGDITWSNDYSEPGGECTDQATQPVTFTATDACGNSSSTIGIIKNTVSTGIEELSRRPNIKTYPNPASDNVHVVIDSDLNIEKTILLYDLGGKLISKDMSSSNEWDIRVSDFSRGIYILRVITEKSTLTQKIVVE